MNDTSQHQMLLLIHNRRRRGLQKIDDVDQDGIEFEHFFDGDFGKSEFPPPHDEPSIRGLK